MSAKSVVFESMLVRERSRMKCFAAKILGNTQDADDILQETYVKLSSRGLSDQDKGLIFSTIKTLALDHIRSRKIRSEHIGCLAADDFLTEQIGPERITASKHDLNAFFQAVDTMPRRRARILLLARVEGMKYREIADVLHLSLSTIEKEMAAAMAFCHKWKQSRE